MVCSRRGVLLGEINDLFNRVNDRSIGNLGVVGGTGFVTPLISTRIDGWLSVIVEDTLGVLLKSLGSAWTGNGNRSITVGFSMLFGDSERMIGTTSSFIFTWSGIITPSISSCSSIIVDGGVGKRFFSLR